MDPAVALILGFYLGGMFVVILMDLLDFIEQCRNSK